MAASNIVVPLRQGFYFSSQALGHYSVILGNYNSTYINNDKILYKPIDMSNTYILDMK